MVYRAFTLLEVLVVVGIIALISSIAGITSIDAYRKTLTKEDIAELVSITRNARILSVTGSGEENNNTASRSHGIKVFPHEIILFSGASYQTRATPLDASYPLLGPETFSSTGEIVFAPYTGRTENENIISVTVSKTLFWKLTVNTAGGINTSYAVTP